MPRVATPRTRAKVNPPPDDAPLLPIPEDAGPLSVNPTERPTGLGFFSLDEEREVINILYYGREGSAKSTNGATLANLGRVLIINAEGGAKRRALAKRGINVSNIQVWPQRGEPITIEGLQAVHNLLQADLADDPNSWVGVMFDSATEIHQALLEGVSSKRISAMQDDGKNPDPWFTDRGDYGVMAKQFNHLLRRFRDLPCHFVVTALERRDVDEDTGAVQYGPAVTPGIANDLLGYVDFVLVAKAEDEDGGFRALTKRKGRWRAKDRFDVLPEIMGTPTVERVLQYVNGDLTEDTDPLRHIKPTKGAPPPEDEE